MHKFMLRGMQTLKDWGRLFRRQTSLSREPGLGSCEALLTLGVLCLEATAPEFHSSVLKSYLEWLPGFEQLSNTASLHTGGVCVYLF